MKNEAQIALHAALSPLLRLEDGHVLKMNAVVPRDMRAREILTWHVDQ